MLDFDEEIQFAERKNDILTVGELLIDMIPDEYGDQLEATTFQKYFGGSPSNIAMNVKKLGIDSLVVSTVGKDGFGEYLVKQLQQASIDTSYIQRVNKATSLVVVSKSTHQPVPIFYRGADYHLRYTKQTEEAILQSNIVHFSCWPVSKQPARETVEKVINTAKKHNIWIGFDPNYHPLIWEQGEEGVAYIKSLVEKVDFIKPSEDDAERLFGKDSPENQIKKFLGLGAKLVIMTLGRNGAIASNGKEWITFPSLATDVIDTTGAGDAFWSGFYTALIKGYTIRKSIELGFAVSAHKLLYTGAIVPLPSLETIKNKYHL